MRFRASAALGGALLAACSTPGDHASTLEPPHPVALGTSFDVLAIRSIEPGPLCPTQTRSTGIRPMAGQLGDCGLGSDPITVIDATCDDGACERESVGPADHVASVRLRANKVGMATVRIRARGSDGEEIRTSTIVEIAPPARITLRDQTVTYLHAASVGALDAPFSQVALAPGMLVERSFAIASTSGDPLYGLPDLSAVPEATWEPRGVGLASFPSMTVMIRAATPGVIPLELRAGEASVREDIHVVAVATSAPVRLHVVEAGRISPPLAEIDVPPGDVRTFALSAAGPDARPVLLPAETVPFDGTPGLGVRPAHRQPGSAWVEVATSTAASGSLELRARGHLVARVNLTR